MDDPETADAARLAERRRDGELVERIRGGDQQAFAELYEIWFDRVHDLAGRILRDPDRAAEVAQDTFLVAWQKLDTLSDPASFGGWLLRITRNRSLNRAEREQRSHALDDAGWATIERDGTPVSAPSGFTVERRLAELDDPALVASDHEMTDLVWSTVAGMGERDATVLDLQLRHGLSPAEIGDVLDINRNAANQLVHRVRGRFQSALEARVLWDGDEPVCELLQAELAEAGLADFDPAAIKLAERHAKSCEECGERRRLRLQPAALFGAVPIIVAPSLLKQHVAAALAADGVPIDPQTVAAASASTADAASGRGPEGSESSTSEAEAARSEMASPSLKVAVAAAVLAAFLFGVWLASGGGPMQVSTDAAQSSNEDLTVAGAEGVGASTTTVVSAPTTTVPPPSSSPLVSVPEPGFVDPGGTLPPTSVNPVPPPLPPNQPPAPTASISMSINPSQRPASTTWTMTSGAPILTWTVTSTGSVTIQVTGPGGVSSSAASGSVALCPLAGGWGSGMVCPAVPAGVHIYRVRVLSGTTVIAERTATLTVI